MGEHKAMQVMFFLQPLCKIVLTPNSRGNPVTSDSLKYRPLVQWDLAGVVPAIKLTHSIQLSEGVSEGLSGSAWMQLSTRLSHGSSSLKIRRDFKGLGRVLTHDHSPHYGFSKGHIGLEY